MSLTECGCNGDCGCNRVCGTSDGALRELYFRIAIDGVGALDAAMDRELCKARLGRLGNFRLQSVTRGHGRTFIEVIFLSDRDVDVESFEFRQRLTLVKKALKSALKIAKEASSRVYFCGEKLE